MKSNVKDLFDSIDCVPADTMIKVSVGDFSTNLTAHELKYALRSINPDIEVEYNRPK